MGSSRTGRCTRLRWKFRIDTEKPGTHMDDLAVCRRNALSAKRHDVERGKAYAIHRNWPPALQYGVAWTIEGNKEWRE